jgi:hypothetical protein
MKLKLFISAMLLVAPAWAQNSIPPGPSLPTTPGLPASPVNRGLPASPVNPGLPGFTNAFGALSMTNQFGTNFLPSDLPPLLVNLQNDLSQLLPALAAFNDSLEFVSLAEPASAATSQSGVNLGSNLSGNFSSVPAGINAGQNFSSVTGGTAPVRSSIPAFNGTNGAVMAGLTGGSANTAAFTNGSLIGFSGTSRDSLRALIILQYDLQRLLPLVSALNGSPVESVPGSLTSTIATGSTNRPFSPFPIQKTPLFPNQSTPLTPTGR